MFLQPVVLVMDSQAAEEVPVTNSLKVSSSIFRIVLSVLALTYISVQILVAGLWEPLGHFCSEYTKPNFLIKHLHLESVAANLWLTDVLSLPLYLQRHLGPTDH